MTILKAVCAYVRVGRNILAVSRKDDRYAFGLPGGKIDPGETPKQAIIREMKEETGLDFIDPELIFCEVCPGGKDGIEYLTYCFVGDILGQIQTTEKGVVEFVPERMLLDGPFGIYNKALFESLVEKNNVKGTGSHKLHEGTDSTDS